MDKLKIIFNSLPDREKEFICGSTEYGLEFNPETDIQFGDEDFCVAQIRKGRNAYWLTIITHPNHRRIGCAAYALDAVKKYIKRQNNPWPIALCSKICKENVISRRWHEKMGFEKEKEEGNQFIYAVYV